MQSCESRLALRAALYRRAVACAWLAISSQQSAGKFFRPDTR